MNEQSLQNTPFTPGRPVVVPTSSFTREVQESIVDNYFNGTGSVYANTVDNYNKQFRSQQSAATEPAQTQQSVAQPDTPQLSADEIASLTKIKRMIDGNPNILNEIARRELSQDNQQQNTQSQTTVPAEGSNSFAPNNVSKNEPSSADLWDQLFSQNESGTPQDANTGINNTGTDDVQTGQTEPSNSPTVFDQRFKEALYAECLKNGQDYKEVYSFTNEFVKDPTGFIELYKAVQEVKKQQSQQAQGGNQISPSQSSSSSPVNLSEAPTPNNVRTLASPAFGNINTNPYWR